MQAESFCFEEDSKSCVTASLTLECSCALQISGDAISDYVSGEFKWKMQANFAVN